MGNLSNVDMSDVNIGPDASSGYDLLPEGKYLAKVIAVIKEDNGSFYAIEAMCKHQNANLFTKGYTGTIMTCPRHGWKYNIQTGQCLTEAWASLRKFPLKIEGDEIFIDLSNPIEFEDDDY